MDRPTQLPDAIQNLIRERVRSVEQLEILLLLHSDRSRRWSDSEVSSALHIGSEWVRSALTALVQTGLCCEAVPDQGPTQFEPRDAAVEAAVNQLAQIYEQSRVEVLVFLSQNAISRVREDALRTFADAFRLAGKKDG